MPEIVFNNNTNEIDPVTGLEYSKIAKGRGFKLLPVPTEGQMWGQATSGIQESPDYNQIFTTESKYDKSLRPGQLEAASEDQSLLEDYRSEEQSAGRAALFALSKGLAKTGVNVLGGTFGAAYSIGSLLATGAKKALGIETDGGFHNLYDNSVVNELDSWSKGLDAAMPVYKSSNYASDNLLENMIKNPVMFMDSATDAISFTAGAVVTGYLTGGIASYFRLAKSINDLQKATRFGAGVLDGLSIEQSAQKLATLGKIDDVLGNARKIITGSAYEASVETNNLAKEMRIKGADLIDKELEAKYKPLFDQAIAMDTQAGIYGGISQEGIPQQGLPNNLEKLRQQYDAERSFKLKQLEDSIQRAGIANYITNLAILSTSHAMQFSPTFGMRWSGARKILPKGSADFVEGTVAREGVEGAVDKTLKATVKEASKFEKGLNVARNIVEKPATEGLFEEGLQGASSNTMQDYYLRKYDPQNFGEAEDLLGSVSRGLAESYGTNQGWKEIGMGMLIGGLGAPGKGLLPGALGIDQQTGERKSKWTGGIVGSFKDDAKKKESIQRVVDRYNTDAANTTIHMKAGYHSVIADMAAKKGTKQSIEEGNKKGFLDNKDDSYFGFVHAREAAGVGNTIDTEITAMEKMSPDEYIQTYSGDMSELTSMTAEQKKEHQANTIQELKDKTAKIRESISLVNSIEPSDPINNYDPDTEDYKQQLSYLLSKGDLIDLRQNQLKDYIDSKTGNVVSGDEAKKVAKDQNTLNIGNRLEVKRALKAKKLAENKEYEIGFKQAEYEEKETKTKEKIQRQEDAISEISDKVSKSEKESSDIDEAIESLHKELDKIEVRFKTKNKVNKSASEKASKESISEINELHQSELDRVNTQILLLERDKERTAENINNQKEELKKQQKVLESINDEYIKAQAEHSESIKQLESDIATHKSDYKRILETRQLLAKAQADKRGVEFKWDNFEKYAEEVERVINARADLEDKINELPNNSIEREKLIEAFRDMESLENSRQEAIELLNFFKSKTGRAEAKLKLRKARYNLFNAIALKKEENKMRAEELAKEWVLNKKYKIKYTVKDSEGKPIEKEETFICKMISTKANPNGEKGYVNSDNGSFSVNSLEALFNSGQIISIDSLTEEDIVKDSAKEEMNKVGRMNKESGKFSLTGKVATVTTKEEGKEDSTEEYFIVNLKTKEEVPYQVWYIINEDDTIGPEYLSSEEIPAEFDLAPETSERDFTGDLVSYTINDGTEINYGMRVLESPFLEKEEAEDALKYPKKVTFYFINSPIKGENVEIDDKNIIKALVDAAKNTPKGSSRIPIGKKNYPIITYDGREGYITYQMSKANRVSYYKKGKDGKSRKYYKTYYNKIGERVFNSYELEVAPETTTKALEEAKASGTLHSGMFKSLSTKAQNHSFDLGGAYELVQDDYVAAGGSHYVVVKNKNTNKLYAVKKDTRYYPIYNESSISRKSYDGLGTLTYKNIKLVGNKLSEEVEQGSHVLNSETTIILTAQHPHMFFTAGRDVEFIIKESASGNKYLVDKRDENGNLLFNPDENQQRWFNFLRQPRTKEEVEEFKKYKLKVVVNKGEWSDDFGFDKDNSISPKFDKDESTQDTFDKLEIRVVVVDSEGKPVLVDGKPVFNSLYLPEFTGYTANSDEELAHERKQFKTFRDSVLLYLKTEMSKDNEYPDLFLDIVGLTAGMPAFEESIANEDGTKTRVRKNVIGRIVPEGTAPEAISWTIVTSNENGEPIPGTVELDGVTHEVGAKNKKFIGSAVTGILGANGTAITVPLLNRLLTEKEATTIAMLFKKVLTGETEFGGMPILPNNEENINKQMFYLKNFIKYGKNRYAKDTQIFYDAKDNSVHYGRNGILTSENIETDLPAFINWLQATKIHHVSKGIVTDPKSSKQFSIMYIAKDGTYTTVSYTSYNEYLFTGDNPVLSTDLVPTTKTQIVQPSIEYKSALYERKPFDKTGTSRTSKSTSTSKESIKVNQDADLEANMDKEALSTAYDLVVSTMELSGKGTTEHASSVIKGVAIMMMNKNSGLHAFGEESVKEYVTRKLKEGKIDTSQEPWFDDYLKTLNVTSINQNPVAEAFTGAPPINSMFGEPEVNTTESTKTPEVKPDTTQSVTKERTKENQLKINKASEEAKKKPVNLDDLRLVTTEPVATENIQEVKNWFEKNLPDMPLEIVDNLINTMKGNAWGVFTGHAVKLYKMAELGTGFHEAYHVVSRLGLTKKQRERFYNTVRSELNSPNMTDNECEELLAEDFRNWMLTGKSDYYTPNKKKVGFFQKIWNFIKNIVDYFTGDKGLRNTIDLYTKINTGGFAHINTKGVKSSKEEWYRKLNGLSETQNEDLRSGVAAYSMAYLYKYYDGDFVEFGKNIDSIIQDATNVVLASNTVPDSIKDVILDNEIEYKKGIKEYFNYIGLALEEEGDTREEGGGQQYQESVYFSNLRNTSNEVKLLIATLPMIGKDGNIMLNSVGLPRIVDFAPTYTRLLDALGGTPHWGNKELEPEFYPVSIMGKLEKLALEFPEYDKLINRFKLLKGHNQIYMQNAFRQAMSINKYSYLTWLIDNNGGKFIESNQSRVIDRLREQLDAAYKASELYHKGLHGQVTNEAIRDRGHAAIKNWDKFKSLMIELGFDKVLDIKAVFDNSVLQIELITSLSDMFKGNNFTAAIDERGGRLKKVLEFQAKHANEYFEPQHVNAAGKSVYEYSLNNYYSYVANIINNASKLRKLEDKLRFIETYLPHLANVRDTSDWYQEIIGLMKSNKQVKLDVTFFEGMEDSTSHKEGAVAYDLSPTELMVMHVEGALKDYPVFTLRRPSDKSLEPGISGFGKQDFFEPNVKSMLLKYIAYDYKTSNGKYNIFRNILSPATMLKVEQTNGKSAEPFVNDIYNDFLKYIQEQTNDLIGLTNELKITKDSFSKELLQKYKGLEDLLEDYALQYFVSRVEQHQFFLGDFTQFKQLFKRTSGATGTGKSFSNDTATNKLIQDHAYELMQEHSGNKMERLDLLLKLNEVQLKNLGITGILPIESTLNSVNVSVLKEQEMSIDDLSQKLRAGYEKVIEDSLSYITNKTVRDARIAQYMSAYNKMDIADGLGFITLEQYREWFIKSGDWDWKKQEPAYQKVVRGEKLTADELAVFPIIKPQGFGPRNYITSFDSKSGIRETKNPTKTNMFFAKLSLAPLIPQAIAGTEMEELMLSMRQSGSTIAIHESGLKNEFERSANPIIINDFKGEKMKLSSFNADNAYWKIQVDIHAELEEADIDGTQQRKLLWLDLFNGSIPADYKEDNWNGLSYEGKKKASNIFRLYEEYKQVYKDIIETEKAKFLKELTIEPRDAEGNFYVISDYKKFTEEIRKEIAARRLPSNVLDAVVADSKDKMRFPIDALTIADKIENLLYARAIKSTIRLKRPGAAYVQTSNAYYRTKGQAYLSSENLTPEQQAKAAMFAKELNFIEPTFNSEGKLTGVKAAEVYLPNYMREVLGDNIDISKIKDKRLLNLMGYRIPTQGQNSMMPLTVKGFLPAEMGDTVIVPYAIVAQSGSDFDIDKLHIFRPNFIKIDGNVRYVDSSITDAQMKDTIDALEKLLAPLRMGTLPGESIASVKEAAFMLGITDDSVEAIEAELSSLKGKTGERLKKLQNQNRLLEIQLEILTSPYVARNMIVPNGAPFLKEEAAFTLYLETFYKKIAGIEANIALDPSLSNAAIIEKFKLDISEGLLSAIRRNSPTTTKDAIFRAWESDYNNSLKKDKYKDLLSYRHELTTGMAFKGGKKGVGIVANYSTFHAICQQVPVKINTYRNVRGYKIVKGRLAVEYAPEPLRFNFFHVGKLGSVRDVNGELISEQFSEHLTANVDIAKDPFIFYLNTNSFTSNIKYMMIAMGTGGEFANRFLTQPIIKEYVTERLKNESIIVESTRKDKGNTLYESNNDILEALAKKYGLTVRDGKINEALNKLHSGGVALTLDNLNNNMVNTTNAVQLQVLADFVKYLDYSKDFSNIVSAVKPDTAKVKNNSEASAIMENIQEIYETAFISKEDLDKLYDSSLLQGFSKNHASLYKKIYQSLFVTESENVQKFIYSTIKNDVKLNRQRMSDKEIDKIRQFFMGYLLQLAINNNKPFSKAQLEQARVGNSSVAKEVNRALISNSKSETPNRALDILYSKLADVEGSPDLIKTSNKKIDPITANLITEGFNLLKATAPTLYDKLLMVTAMQTGFNYSPINFLKYFDSNELSTIFAATVEKAGSKLMETIENIDDFIDAFYNVNRKNSKLVPFIRPNTVNAKLDFDGNVLTLTSQNNNYGRKFLRRMESNPNIDSGKKFDILYKLYGFDDSGAAIYIKHNLKGGTFSMEVHNEINSFDKSLSNPDNSITEAKVKELKNLTKVKGLSTLANELGDVNVINPDINTKKETSIGEYTDFEMITKDELLEDYPQGLSGNNIKYYTGNITPEPNTIFVFGSNPEGRHGKGAAKIAVQQFGAIYGQGEGLQGSAYALPTKDLRIKENNGFKSISEKDIIDNIIKLYEVAEENPRKQFKIAYRNTTDVSLNGYTGLEMIDMFNNAARIGAGYIPSNIIFSKEWVDTGKLSSTNYSNLAVITNWASIKDKWLTKYTKADWDNMNQEEREVVIKKCL